MYRKMVLMVGLLLAAAGMLHAEKTVAFQMSAAPVGDYVRCTDTFVASLYRQVPFGEDGHLAVSGQGTPSYVIVRFEIGDYIPLSATVTGAKILLYPKLCTAVEKNLRWYETAAGNPWKENEATWEVASIGVPWTSPGGDVLTVRRSGPVEPGDGVHAWDVTDVVQYWVKFPEKNLGMMLRPGSDSADFECWYYSSESKAPAMRPRLEVTYVTADELAAIKLKAEEEARKKNEKAVAEMMEQKKEEKLQKMTQTKRPEAPWEVCELKEVLIDNWTDVEKIPFWLEREAARSNEGVLRAMDPDPAEGSFIAKYGEGKYLSNVSRLEGGDAKNFVVRIKSNAFAQVDTDNDGTYGPEEKWKIVRGVAGPITIKGVYNSRSTSKIAHDYPFYVYARNADPADNSHWGMRHASYRQGEFNGLKIRLYDENDNCRYNDYGYDRLVIIDEKQANKVTEQFLNTYIEINGAYYKVDAAASGEFIAFAKVADLAGETGIAPVAVDLFTGFDGGSNQYMPEFVMFYRTDRDKGATYTADQSQKVVLIPQGQYRVMYSRAASRSKREKLVIDGQNMPPVDLTGKEQYVLKWGFPLTIVFAVNRLKDKYTFGTDDNSLRIRDAAGCAYSIEDGKAIFLNPPTAEFYAGSRCEVKKQVADGMSITVKNEGKYRIVVSGKSVLLGELSGELEK